VLLYMETKCLLHICKCCCVLQHVCCIMMSSILGCCRGHKVSLWGIADFDYKSARQCCCFLMVVICMCTTL
jgi:hypothetical protein